jgi:hypothetical protein
MDAFGTKIHLRALDKRHTFVEIGARRLNSVYDRMARSGIDQLDRANRLTNS